MGWKGALDRYFEVSARGSTVGREIKSGVVTFLTMSYILIVNPQILGVAGLPVKAVAAATALTAMVSSFLTGVLSNLPVGISPGMGLNAYFVFSQVLGLGVSINKALAGCFTAACVVALLAVVHALRLILAIVPNSIKLAVVVGMGLLLSFIGLHSSQIVVPDARTMVAMGDLLSLQPALAIGGLAVIAALHYRNVRGSIIVGVLLTALAYFIATDNWPSEFMALPRLQFFALDFSDLFGGFNPAAWSAVLAYTLVMIFDIGGAMFGLGNLAGLLRDGAVPGATYTYLAAAAGTALGAATGTTPLIIAAESAVGIKEGGRTGLVALTVSALFALSMVLSPLLEAIPQVATAPVLVLVGAMMMGECVHIDWSTMLTAVPAFLTIVIQPFTFSIANGIYAGLVMAALLYILTGEFLTALPWGKGGGAVAGLDGDASDLEARLLIEGAAAYGAAAPAPIEQTPAGQSPRARPGGDTPRAGPAGGVPIGGSGGVTPRPHHHLAAHEIAALAGSLTSGAAFERGSFTMYINTHGSAGRHRGGGGSLSSGTHSAHGSEAEHHT